MLKYCMTISKIWLLIKAPKINRLACLILRIQIRKQINQILTQHVLKIQNRFKDKNH